MNKVDILAFGAHPDDVECAAGGVLLKHIAMGKKIVIADLSAGELGSYGNVETRKVESKIAGNILGLINREQLGLEDGAIENNEISRIKVIQTIRKYQPDIVLCNAINDRHPDHAHAAKLVKYSVFLSGLREKKTWYNGVLQQEWRPTAVYHYIQDYFIEPDFVIDITEQMNKKIEAILAFKSQFVEPKDNQPNSILGLLDQIKNTNSILGRQINVLYAEGFNVNRYIGVPDFYKIF